MYRDPEEYFATDASLDTESNWYLQSMGYDFTGEPTLRQAGFHVEDIPDIPMTIN